VVGFEMGGFHQKRSKSLSEKGGVEVEKGGPTKRPSMRHRQGEGLVCIAASWATLGYQ